MLFKVVSLDYLKSIKKAVTTFLSFESQKMGPITRDMYDYYKQLMLQTYVHSQGLSFEETCKISAMVESFLAQITGYLQVNAPIAFPENGFFPQRGYSRGRENQEALLSFLNSSGLRFEGNKLAADTIFINRKFVDNFHNRIVIEMGDSNDEKLGLSIKQAIKDLLKSSKDVSGSNFFVELVFSKDKEIAKKQKAIANDVLLKYLKGFQVKDYNLLIFEYGQSCGLLTMEPLIIRGEFGNLKSLLSRHGAILDARVLANNLMRKVEPATPESLTHEQLKGAAEYFNVKKRATNNAIESLEKLLENFSKKSVRSLDEVEFVRHLSSGMVKEALTDIKNTYNELNDVQKEFVSGVLRRLENILTNHNNIDQSSTRIKQERFKYLLIAEELAILHAVFDTKQSAEQYLKEDSILDIPGLRRNSFIYNSGMSALSEMMQELKPKLVRNISAVVDENVYYEMPEMFKDIFGKEQVIEKFADHNGFYGDIAFFDMHPNNPNSVLIKNVTVQKIIDDLSGIDFSLRDTKLNLVIDVSTHGMYDGEALELLNSPLILKLILENKLIVVTLQSLAKFGSLGTDKFNGAIINVYDSGKSEISDNLQKRTASTNVVRGSIADRYFKMLFSLGPNVHAEFVSRARVNANLLYKMLREINKILYGERELKFLQENQDPKLIYISLKYAPYFPQYMKGGIISDKVQKGLLYAISVYLSRVRNNELLVNTRSGFGFIESAVSCCGESLRFMLGAGESKESLVQYAEILLGVEQILNDNIDIISRDKKALDEFLSGDCLMLFQDKESKYTSVSALFESGNSNDAREFIRLVEKSNYQNSVKQRDILYLELQRIYYGELKE